MGAAASLSVYSRHKPLLFVGGIVYPVVDETGTFFACCVARCSAHAHQQEQIVGSEISDGVMLEDGGRGVGSISRLGFPRP